MIAVDFSVFCSLHNPYVFHRSSIAGPGCETFYSFYSGGPLSLHSAALSSPASHFVTYWRRVTGRQWNARNGSSPSSSAQASNCSELIDKRRQSKKKRTKELDFLSPALSRGHKAFTLPTLEFFCIFLELVIGKVDPQLPLISRIALWKVVFRDLPIMLSYVAAPLFGRR